MVPDMLWYHTAYIVTCQVLSILMYWPGQLPSRASVISRELQTGGNSICLCLTGVLLVTPPSPPRRPPWTACVHFHDSNPIDVSHLSFTFLCLSLLQVSISVVVQNWVCFHQIRLIRQQVHMYWKNAGLKHNLVYVIQAFSLRGVCYFLLKIAYGTQVGIHENKKHFRCIFVVH